MRVNISLVSVGQCLHSSLFPSERLLSQAEVPLRRSELLAQGLLVHGIRQSIPQVVAVLLGNVVLRLLGSPFSEILLSARFFYLQAPLLDEILLPSIEGGAFPQKVLFCHPGALFGLSGSSGGRFSCRCSVALPGGPAPD